MKEEAVLILDSNVIGFIVKHYIGGALVQYEDNGISFEEYLSDEDYTVIEEWSLDG